MARLNVFKLNFGRRKHEGAPARQVSTERQLRRTVLACLLWESQFYEDGVEIAGRIAALVPKVAVEKVAGSLTTPDTWEVALSSGADKREAWERLPRERKLGGLALLRNLRNVREVGVDEALVVSAIRSMNTARVLPFRFLAAARYAPKWEEALEQAMLKCVAETEKLPVKTIVLVDVSGSMTPLLSLRSEMQRTDAAYVLALLLSEIAE